MEEEDSFYYDMCNIARILPTLSPSTIYTELNTLRDNSERVQIIIRKYFEEYEPKNHNCMTEDIKKIKRVLPTYPIVKISNDLLSVENQENRVQIVLKNYFDSQNKSLLKRCLDNVNEADTSPGKKLKPNDDSIDFHSEIVDQTDEVSNKEKSSNETENYTPTSEDMQTVVDQLIPQESETNNVEEAICIQIETTEKPGEANLVSLGTNDQISSDSKEINNECENTEPSSKVDECGITLLSILSNLFPQHSLDVFNAICEDFGLNLHGVPNEITTDLVVNVLLNYTSNANKFEQDKTEICTNQPLVTDYCAELSDFGATAAVLCGDNKSVADCDEDETSQKSSTQDCNVDLEDYLKETVKDFLSNINTDDKNNDVQTSLITEEPVQTAEDIPSNSNSTSENIPLTTNLSSLLPSVDSFTESTASTSKIINNRECTTFDNSQSINSVINNRYAGLKNRFDKPFNITSKSTNISELSTLRSPYSISKSNSSVINNSFNKHKITNHILNPDIDPGLIPISGASSTFNNFQPALHMSTKQPVLTSRTNSIIKPATFHPSSSSKNSTVSQSDVVRIDLENLTRSSNILKPASFTPRSNSNATSTHTTGVNTNLQNMNCSLPSTSGIFNISDLPTTSSQDINKNTIRVRTDLYDTFFNGPVILSTPIVKNKQEENDDIIFVSAEQLPIESVINLSTNKTKNPVKSNENVVQEETLKMNSGKDQQSTSKACDNLPNHPFYFKLLEIFPDICPNYLKQKCSEIKENETMDDMISILLNGNYSKRNKPDVQENHIDFEEQHKILQDLFPDADPTYLQHHCERLIDQPDNFKQFVASLFENKNYPTKSEYLKKMKLSAQEKQYTTEFNVKNFLEVIPNPEEYFNDPKRQAICETNFDDINYGITFLKNKFCTTAIKDITSVFKKTNFSILQSAVILDKFQNMKTKRKPYPITSCKNIPLLQEIAYVKHKKQIEEYIKNQELEKKVAKENAKLSGLMKTCQCCFDDEVMPDDTATCETGLHIFCKTCIRKSCEVVIGDGKLQFPCLETCDSFFTLQVLQIVLAPKVFSKMAQRKQLEEVKSAGIEDLESCPFCDFATIPAPEDKIFRCLNDDCMKESCRLCKEPSHIPLRCEEVEKDKDVKMRTYIENKMTEALLRQCYKCGLKFIKESGCNKMTCSCGAMMCYVCNKPVKDYKHFNGQGGDQFQLCPLYSDTHKLHVDAVKRSAESAKKELGIQKEDELKIDPSADLELHYRRLAEQNPAIQNIPNIMPQLPR